MVYQRFRCLERRLASKPQMHSIVKHQLIGSVPEEFARCYPNWYQSLDIVLDPRKQNKERLKRDATAAIKDQGQSLNSASLAGPDLLTPLPAVQCLLRQFKVDIKSDACGMSANQYPLAAVELLPQVKLENSKAGFNIANWLPIADRVLAQVGEYHTDSSMLWVDRASADERVIGLVLNPEANLFMLQGMFRRKIQEPFANEVVSTKIAVLRFAISTFKSIGLTTVLGVHVVDARAEMLIRWFNARRRASNFDVLCTSIAGASRELNTDSQWRSMPSTIGRFWEYMVQSVKSSLLTEVEYIMNTRPPIYLLMGSEEQEGLTVNRIRMLSTSGGNQPAKELIVDTAAGHYHRNLCQLVLNRFWSNWIVNCKPVQLEDLVVVVDERVRHEWTRGRVVPVFPDRGGKVRHTEVNTANEGVLDRSGANLAVLEVDGIAEAGFVQYGSGIVTNGEDPAPGCERVNQSTRNRMNRQ